MSVTTVRSTWFHTWRLALCALLGALSISACKETQEPIHTVIEQCKPDDTRTRRCGINGNGTHIQGCRDGKWIDSGTCEDPDICPLGETQFVACGANDSGTMLQYCEDGQWEDAGTCEDADVCEGSETKDVACGHNDQGTATLTCDNGKWGEPGTCDDPDVCVNKSRQRIDCGGLNGNATQQERCTDGQWEALGDCEDPDVCVLDDTRTVTCGGLNGNATQQERCIDGQWREDGECLEPDTCTDGTTKNEFCGGLNGRAVQQYLCEDGTWETDGNCVDPDECTDNDTTTENCGGYNGNAERTLTCTNGQWTNGSCIDPDECTNHDTRSHSCGAQDIGEQIQTCHDGQWEDGSTCELEVAGFDTNSTHACALAGAQQVVCWGQNNEGQIGDATTNTRAYPTAAALNIEDIIVNISTGHEHTCLFTIENEIYCWGNDSAKQSGARGGAPNHTPTLITSLDGLQPHDLAGLETGEQHSCAIDDEGYVYCWGDNQHGQLGIAASVPQDLAVNVPFIDSTNPAVDLSVGWNHSCALLDDGTIACWGRNDDGQLGDGTTTDNEEAYVLDIGDSTAPAIEVSAGKNHTCAVTEDDELFCWGDNQFYQLGVELEADDPDDPPPTYTDTPVRSDLSPDLDNPILQINSGTALTCALLEDLSLYCWGDNSAGAAGFDAASQPVIDTPTQLPSAHLPDNIVMLRFRDQTPCALLADQRLHCWGDNQNLVRGTGSGPSDHHPAEVTYDP